MLIIQVIPSLLDNHVTLYPSGSGPVSLRTISEHQSHLRVKECAWQQLSSTVHLSDVQLAHTELNIRLIGSLPRDSNVSWRVPYWQLWICKIVHTFKVKSWLILSTYLYVIYLMAYGVMLKPVPWGKIAVATNSL